jgi:hypothetical protein
MKCSKFWICCTNYTVKVQNGSYIQGGVESVYIFHSIFTKMIFNMKDDIFQKIARSYYSSAAE